VGKEGTRAGKGINKDGKTALVRGGSRRIHVGEQRIQTLQCSCRIARAANADIGIVRDQRVGDATVVRDEEVIPQLTADVRGAGVAPDVGSKGRGRPLVAQSSRRATGQGSDCGDRMLGLSQGCLRRLNLCHNLVA